MCHSKHLFSLFICSDCPKHMAGLQHFSSVLTLRQKSDRVDSIWFRAKYSSFDLIQSQINFSLGFTWEFLHYVSEYLRELKALCCLWNWFIAGSGWERWPRGLEEDRVRRMDGDTVLKNKQKQNEYRIIPAIKSIVCVCVCTSRNRQHIEHRLKFSFLHTCAARTGI